MKTKTLILCGSLLSCILNGMSNVLSNSIEQTEEAFLNLGTNSHEMTSESIQSVIQQMQATLASLNNESSSNSEDGTDSEDDDDGDDIQTWQEIFRNDLYVLQEIDSFLQGADNIMLLKNLASSSYVFCPIILKAFNQKGIQF